MKTSGLQIALTLSLSLLLAAGSVPQAQPAVRAALPQGVSLLFVENVGQFDARVRFQARLGKETLWLTEDALWLTLANAPTAETHAPPRATVTQKPRASGVKLEFVGANPHPRLEAFDKKETRFNYLRGQNPADFQINVPVWGSVRYVDIYPGVDLLVGRARDASLWWKLETRPGADLSAARLRVAGADAAALQNGVLRLTTAAGEINVPLLQIDTAISSRRTPQIQRVAAQTFEITAPFAPFAAALANNARSPDNTQNAAALSPVYATYLGGYFSDYGANIAVDSAGAVYVTGSTSSPDFPASPGEFYNGGDSDAFVAKLNAAGSALEFATFLGGVGDDLGDDFGYGIAVDGGGIYLTGWTNSVAFPVTAGAYDTSYNGGYHDAFAAKLNAAGSALLYATYLGGTGREKGIAIALNGSGNAYVAGWTDSADFPTVAANSGFDAYQGGNDAFAVKLNADASALEYALLIGGSDTDEGYGLDVDAQGYACLAGATQSDDFPLYSAADDTLDGGLDAFVSCVKPSGGDLFYSSYLGGSGEEQGKGVAIDNQRRAYVTGATTSTDFPETGGSCDDGDSHAFVAKVSASTLHYVACLGDD